MVKTSPYTFKESEYPKSSLSVDKNSEITNELE